VTAPRQARAGYGPGRPAAHLGLGRWQLARTVQSGLIPSAVRAAGMLSGRLGPAVTADGVEELARRGLLPVGGSSKGCPLHDGRALEAFTDARGDGPFARLGGLTGRWDYTPAPAREMREADKEFAAGLDLPEAES
jgi:hypothetical protein